jgi:OOP family OmpA-OmpF porin
MKSFYNRYILSLTLFLLLFINAAAQTSNNQNYFLHQNFILSLETGATYGFTDYENSNLAPLFLGSLEYYPIAIDNARLGLKIFGGGLRISQTDYRGSLPSNDLPSPREVPTGIHTDMIQIGSSLNLGYAVNESIIPYISVGTAFLIFSPKDFDGHNLPFNLENRYNKKIFSFVIEGGLKYKISDKFSINAGVSYYPTPTDYLDDISSGKSNDSFLSGTIGLSFALSGSPDSDRDGVPDYLDKCPDTPIGVVVDEFGCPIDSDKDGVPDYLDKCPDTPLGVPVDKDGCPIDTDKDGVPDYHDKCPDTPKGVAVDEFGCPIDSDKDGVPDYLDKCPGTPPNTKVDSTGCPQKVTKQETQQETFYQFVLRGDDTFETNTANLKNGAKLLLNEIAFYIQNQPGTKWRIEGHMDSQGSITFIKLLSYNRAKAVLDYLVSQGLSPNRFTIYGLGDSFPIANSNTEEGRSTNRRIMIIRED